MNDSSVFTLEMIVGLILLTVVLIYLTFATKQSSSSSIKAGKHINVNGAILADASEEKEEIRNNSSNSNDNDDGDEEER